MEKMTDIQKQILASYDEFCQENGHEPRYAYCEIEWTNDHQTCEVVFKLSCDADESEDDKIFFYCNSVQNLLSMTEESAEDFVITEIYSFEDTLL